MPQRQQRWAGPREGGAHLGEGRLPARHAGPRLTSGISSVTMSTRWAGVMSSSLSVCSELWRRAPRLSRSLFFLFLLSFSSLCRCRRSSSSFTYWSDMGIPADRRTRGTQPRAVDTSHPASTLLPPGSPTAPRPRPGGRGCWAMPSGYRDTDRVPRAARGMGLNLGAVACTPACWDEDAARGAGQGWSAGPRWHLHLA